MSVNLTIAGQTFAFPTEGENNWGQTVTQWATAVSTQLLQRTGGNFVLTNDVNFGANFATIQIYLKSRTANISTTGFVRMAKTDGIGWRNNANNADLLLAIDTSNNLTFNGVVIPSAPGGVLPVANGGTGIASYTVGDILYATGSTTLSKLAAGSANYVLVSTGTAPSYALLVNANIDAAAAIAYSKLALTGSIVNADISASAAIDFSKLAALSSANILVGSVGNVATSTAVTGDITISNVGVTAIGSGVIVNADINASAAIAFSKLASLTSANILVGSGGNVATAAAVTGDVSLSNAGVTALVATTNATLTTLSAAAGVDVHGTNTNDDASAGYVGEYIEGLVASPTNFSASATVQDLTTVALTPGDWDVSFVVNFISASAAGLTVIEAFIGTGSGTSTTGKAPGSNDITMNFPTALANGAEWTVALPSFRVSLSGSVTYRLKALASYPSTTAQYRCRLSARRVR